MLKKKENYLKMKAAIYIRVSTNGQVNYGNGLQLQKEHGLKVIENNGWTLYKIYGNEKAGVSGHLSVRERPEFMEMIDDGKSGKFDIVIIYYLDRLGRSVKVIDEARNIIYEANLKLYMHDTFIEKTGMTDIFFRGLAE